MSSQIDDRALRKALSRYAAAAGTTVREAVSYAAKIAAQHAQKETILRTGRGNAGKAASVAAAKRDQLEKWRAWILVMGFPRMSRAMHRYTDWKGRSMQSAAMRRAWFAARMPSTAGLKGRAKRAATEAARRSGKRTREAYFAEAKRRQGELAAGWNAAIAGTKGRYAASWVKRHGALHGWFNRRGRTNVETAEIVFQGTQHGSRGSLRVIAELAVKRTRAGLEKTAAAMLRRRAKK